MDGVFPFLILILVIGASVGIAIGISAIVSRWERSVPKPGMSDFMDISKSLAPGLNPSKVFVLDSASTTFTRSWVIRDATTETVIANVDYETNGDIILKMTSGERFFLENTEPPHRTTIVRTSMDGGLGRPVLIRKAGTLRNADANYQVPGTQTVIATTPTLRTLFPKKLVLSSPQTSTAIATIASMGLLTYRPIYLAVAENLLDVLGEHGCCAVLILESRRFL